MPRLLPALALAALALASAACDRLPALGGEGQPCFGGGDCDKGLICNTQTDTCERDCTPDCSNKCVGVDDGCGGTCAEGCWSGYTCQDQHCDHCEMPTACGPNCDDCLIGDTGWDCVSDGTATFRCGCSDGQAHCASGVCNPDGSCACTPDCAGKNCGDPDGCNGTCVVDCGIGQFCDGVSCAECTQDAHCGDTCDDCTLYGTNLACVTQGELQVSDHFCGCASDGDCAFGETCEPEFKQCFPGGLCGDASNCGAEGDCTTDVSDAGRACVDDGAGSCVCGCGDENDCMDPGLMRCVDSACCTSQCNGSCSGEEDGGCPGQTCDTCPNGLGCLNGTCQLCNTAETCGELCESCVGNASGEVCVDDGGWMHCGCVVNGDCTYGWCDGGLCTPALITGWYLDPVISIIQALAITPPQADPGFPHVAVGGDDNGGQHRIRLWAMDGLVNDVPDLVLGSGSDYHDQPVWALAFAADGDLFSLDESMGLLHWKNQTDSWDLVPVDWSAIGAGSPGFLSVGGQDASLVVAVTTGPLDAEFFDFDQQSKSDIHRSHNITGLALKENGAVAVVTGFDNPGVAGTSGAIAVNMSDYTTSGLVIDQDAFRVALARDPMAPAEAALVVDATGIERLLFSTDLLGTAAQLDNRYDLAESAAQLVLVLQDRWAVVSAEGGRIYAYRVASAEALGPYQIHDQQDCAGAPLLAAADGLLVSTCSGQIRLWDVENLLWAMGAVAP